MVALPQSRMSVLEPAKSLSVLMLLTVITPVDELTATWLSAVEDLTTPALDVDAIGIAADLFVTVAAVPPTVIVLITLASAFAGA